jgi:hypothetical protein
LEPPNFATIFSIERCLAKKTIFIKRQQNYYKVFVNAIVIIELLLKQAKKAGQALY